MKRDGDISVEGLKALANTKKENSIIMYMHWKFWTFERLICTRIIRAKLRNKTIPEMCTQVRFDGRKWERDINWRNWVPQSGNTVGVEVALNIILGETMPKFQRQWWMGRVGRKLNVVVDIKMVRGMFCRFDQKPNIWNLKSHHYWQKIQLNQTLFVESFYYKWPKNYSPIPPFLSTPSL